MTTKRRRNRRKAAVQVSARHLTQIEFKAIAFVSTLILAGVAIVMGMNEPVIWAFLGTAIGITLGQSAKI